MDMGYLNLLPEVENKYNVELQEGEKVVFAKNLHMLGTEKGRWLGTDCEFTLTNKRIIIFNGASFCTINIENDIAGCTRVQTGFFFKQLYLAVPLTEDLVYDNGKERLSGFRFYFEKEEMEQFEEIMNNLLK